MVAIVTGNGLGLSGSSASVLGAGGQVGNAATGLGPDGAYVNAQTGNLVISRQDELLIGLGPDIGIVRTYNSNGTFDFDNNDNWQISLYRRVFGLAGGLGVANSTIKRTAADGTELTYTYDATKSTATDKVYINKDGAGSYDSLTFNTTTNLWTWQDGDSQIKETYEVQVAGATAAEGTHRIKTIADTDGNALTYTYNNLTDSLITQVADANGETTFLDYDTVAGKTTNLMQIRVTYIDAQGNNQTVSRVQYQYDSQNRLITVTTDLSLDNSIIDGKTYVTTYTYEDASKRIASISNSDGTTTSFTYETSGLFRVLTVKDGLNNTTTFTYPASGNTRTITDASGQTTTLTYSIAADSSNGLLTRIQGPSGSGRDISYTYNTNGDVIQTTDGRTNWVKYTYDASGNQLSQQDNAGNTVTRTYGSLNQLLTQTVYATPDANVADTTLAATLPQTTRYAYDIENHLRFIVSPEGRVTEYVYNTPGQKTSEIQYTGDLYAVGSLTPTQSLTETQVNTWRTPAVQVQSQRTDYAYDLRGQLSQTTQFTAINSTTGAGIVDGTQSITKYVYDQAGNLVQSIEARGVVTTGTTGAEATDYITNYTYDGLNRILTRSQSNAAGVFSNTSVTVYNDATRQATTTLLNGLATVSTYDLAGRLLSTARSDASGALGTTTYLYDSLGQLRQKTLQFGTTASASDLKTYYLYDSLGRQVGVIDPERALTEVVYNANNQVVRTIRYNTLVTATLSDTTALTLTLVTTGVRVTDSVNDRTTRTLYDKAGRLAKEIDALGAVTEYFYDGASRLLKTTQYANPLSATQLTAIAALSTELLPDNANTVPVANASADRVTRNFYDNDGLLVGTLDGEGYLTEYTYDKAGRRTQATRYATQTSSANWAAGTFATLKTNATSVSADTVRHQTTYSLYNAQGQLTGTVDAENYLTTYGYDFAGNLNKTVRYKNAMVGTLTANVLPQILTAAGTGNYVVTNTEDQTMLAQYDENNRVTRSETLYGTQAVGTGIITTNTYDNVGNLTKTVKALGVTLEERTQQQRYNSFGQVIAVLSGEGSAALAALGATPTQLQIDTVWNTYGTRYIYDTAGRRIAEISPDGSGATGNKTRLYYDNDGRLTHRINALGEVTQYVYNTFDQVTAERRYNTRIAATPLAALTGGKTSDLGTTISSLTGGYSETQVAYNRDGQAVTLTDALNNANTRTYNTFGELATATDKIDGSTNLVTGYTYDRRGLQLSSTQDSATLNIINSAIYDAFGRIYQTIDGRSNIVKHTYDRLGREVSIINAANVTTQTTYDAFSRVLTTRDGRGVAGGYNTTSYVYDSAARSMTMTTGEGVQMVTTKNRHGETVSIQDGRLNTTTYTYNKDGQLTKTTQADTTTQQTAYDKAGRVFTTTDARGMVTKYSYDATDRVLSKRMDDGGLNLTTSYRYDAKGQAIWTQDANLVWTRTDYDAKGQVTARVVDPALIPDASGNPVANATALAIQTSFTYDARGKTLTVVEGAGTPQARTTRYVYDKAGRRTQTIVDPSTATPSYVGLNITTSYTYDKNDNVVLKTDANGNKTVYSYDANDRLVYTVDALGYVTKNEYDVDGNLLTVTAYATAYTTANLATLQGAPATTAISPTVNATLDHVTGYVYDKDNRLTYTIDAAKAVTKLDYDAAGNVVKRTRYATPLATLPAAGVVPTVTLSVDDRTEQTVYNSMNRAIYSVDANGYVTVYNYTAEGAVFETTRYANAMVGSLATNGTISFIASGTTSGAYVVKNATQDQLTRTTYDKLQRPTFTIDANGAVTQYEYDSLGQLTRITRFANLIVGTPASGMPPTLVTTAPGSGAYVLKDAVRDSVTQQKFDTAGRKTEAIDALGNSTKTEYNAVGDIVKVIDAKGNAGYFYMDALGRVTLQVNPDGAAVETTYNAMGNPVATLRYATRITATLTTGTRPTLTATPSLDQKQTVAYDKLNRKTTIQTWTGLTTSSAAADYYTEAFTYDAFDNVLTSTARNGATTTYTYDKLDRKLTETLPIQSRNASNALAAVVNSYAYDALGNLSTKTEAVGLPEQRVTNYTYDKLGQQLTEAVNVGKTYDPVTDVTTPTDVIATKSRTYDARGNVTSETDANNNKALYYYDKLNQRTGMVDAANVYTLYTYDASGNKTSQTVYANKVTAPVIGTTPSVVTDAANDRTTLIAYDRLGRQTGTTIENIRTGNVNGANQYIVVTGPITTQTIYDALGNITKTIDANGNITRTWYNNAGQIVAQVDALGYLVTWARDVYGNISQETRYAKPPNQATTPLAITDTTTLAQITTTAATLADTANDRITVITFDKLNRVKTENVLSVVSGTVNTTNGALTATTASAITTYTYDGLNNVTQKTDAIGAITNFVYDALGRQLSELDPTFIDYTGASVRPETDREYDGLGNVKREIQRGTLNTANSATNSGQIETDDHITNYIYTYGRLTAQVDPVGIRTEYQYDANGNVTKKTLKNRQTADQQINNLAGTDDVTTYIYDSLNRQVLTKDGGTGLIAEIQYNSFGQIAGKRSYVINAQNPVIPTNWTEFAQYDQAGNTWKSNSGDGVTKVYIYDANGNATLTVNGTLNMSNMTLDQIISQKALDTQNNVAQQTFYTMSVYDQKNQLVNTIQPSMDSSKSVVQVQAGTGNGDGVIVPVIAPQSTIQAVSGPNNLVATILAEKDPGFSGVKNETLNANAFAVIKSDGSVIAWGDGRSGGDLMVATYVGSPTNNSYSYSSIASQLDGTNKVVQIYATNQAFAALRADGSVVTWGLASDGGNSSLATLNPSTSTYSYSSVASQLDGTIPVIKIFSNRNGFAALRADGSVVTWGDARSANSSAVATQLNGTVKVLQIYSTPGYSYPAGAFAALRADGSVVTWGESHSGGDSSAVATQLNDANTRVLEIYASSMAFSALRSDGSVVTWGNSYSGGDSSSVATQLNGSIPIIKIAANLNAFAALRTDGSVVTWGDSDNTLPSQLNGLIPVTQIYSTNYAFAALLSNGAVVTWSTSSTGSTSGGNSSAVASQINGTVKVVKVYSSGGAFAALREDGSVVSWGYNADSSAVASQINGTVKVVKIYSNSSSFAALRADGSVITWGVSSYGGNSSAVATQLNGSIKVIQIYSTSVAYAALRADGSIITWGAPTQGGNSSIAVFTRISSTNSSIAYTSVTTQLSAGVLAGNDPYTDTIVTPYTFQPAIVHITQPTNVQYVKVSYQPYGSTAAYTVVTINDNTSGLFDWNASNLALNPSFNYDYDVIVQAYDSNNVLVNQTNVSQLRLGANAGVIQSNGQAVPTILRVAPPETGVDHIQLVYRLKNSAADYTSLDATQYNNNGIIEFRAVLPSAPALASGLYEYQYTTYAADNSPLGSETGSFVIATTSTSSIRLDYVIINTDSSSNIISRKQSYNAFGEIIQEVDGRGNKTDYTYNTIGKLLQKKDPQVDITLANGFIQVASESTRPTITYTYDLVGRLIAVKDANNNLNTQAWISGFSNDEIVLEKHADSGTRSAQYDIFGNKRVDIDEAARRTDYIYDAGNRLVEIDRPQRVSGTTGFLAARTYDKYTYDAAGQRITHTNSVGDREKTDYDTLGRVTRTASFMGFTTTYTYNYSNNIIGFSGITGSGWIKTTTGTDGRAQIDRMDMFNRVTWHQDEGNHVFTYNYNLAGWLTSQTSLTNDALPADTTNASYTGQNIAYTHYSNGFIQSIQDKATGVYTYYEYDMDGNKTFEGYVSLKNPLVASAGAKDYYEYSTITYDALNRIKTITDPKASISYEYDAVGNRRMVNSVYHDGVNGAQSTQILWYGYDQMNRFTITMGSLAIASTGVVTTTRGTSATDTTRIINKGTTGTANAPIVTSTGVAISYNFAGERVQAFNATDGSTESYTYTSDGYLADTKIKLSTQTAFVLRASRVNDALGRVTTINQYSSGNATGVGSAVNYTRTTIYDKDNRTLTETGTDGPTNYYYFSNNTDSANSSSGAGALAYTTNVLSGTTTKTYYTYQYWDEAKQKAITAQPYNSSAPGWKAGYSDVQYDVNGHIMGAVDHIGNRSFTYLNDAQGQILERNELAGNTVNRIQRYYYVDGKRIGDVGNSGPSNTDYVTALANQKVDKKSYAHWKPISSADFDQNYQPIGPDYPGNSATSYAVRYGDTLQSIALTVWGDAAMWYLIADANGLVSGANLTTGQTLTIPNKVTNLHNNSGTFKVYSPGEAIGDVSPTVPSPPPPPKPKKKHGCGGIGGIIVAIVTVAATIVAASMGVPPVWAAAIGNVAGQVTGNVVGVQSGFDFKSFATSVISAGITQGVLGDIKVGPTSFNTSLSNAVGNGYAAIAARAVVGNVINQGAGNLTGIQQGFSWTSVAASGVGAVAGAYAGNTIGNALGKADGFIQGTRQLTKAAGFATTTVQGLTANVVSQATQIALDGTGRLNWNNVAINGISAGVGYLAGWVDPKNGDMLQDLSKTNLGNIEVQLANGQKYAEYKAGKSTDVPGQESNQGPLDLTNKLLPETVVKPSGVMLNEVRQTADNIEWFNNLYSTTQLNNAPGIGVGAFIPNPISLSSAEVRYTPRNDGSWTGVRGNSAWISSKEIVNTITNGSPVQFKDNIPNFKPWSKGTYNFSNLTGNNSDFNLVHERIAEKLGLPSNGAARMWLLEQGLTAHHNSNGVSIELIPSALHNEVPHLGGASVLRNWDYSKGTPYEVFNANRITSGAKYVGSIGMAWGAYQDGKSLYTEYEISSIQNNYNNTINEGVRIAGGWSAAWAVGTAGAEFGAGFGSVFGPIGTAIGGITGGVIGGVLGYAGGSYALPGVYNDLHGYK